MGFRTSTSDFGHTLVNKLHDNNKLKEKDFSDYRKYFINRYTDEGGIIYDRFRSLKVACRDEKLVEDVLKSSETSIGKVVLALLIIAHRYRNNFFHGEKDIFKLPKQIENFKTTNRMLTKVVELVRPVL